MQGFITMSGASDPRVLLDAMTSMLGEYGDIKGPQEVVSIISLMKDAEKMLSRFTFLNILRATIEIAAENSAALDTIHKFVKDGGCTILNKWLQEGMASQNVPLILDVLELLEALPVTIEALKQGNIGKLVKQLSKREETDVKELASNILSKWMLLVKGKPKKSKKSSEQHSEESNSGSSPPSKRPRENSASKEPKSNEPPEKKVKTLAEAKSSVTSVAKPPPKAKVIAALPKPLAMESSGFMNALIQQTSAPTKKKKKVAPPPSPKQTSAGLLEEILFNQTQTHKQGEEKEVKNTKEKEEKGQEAATNETRESESTPATIKIEPMDEDTTKEKADSESSTATDPGENAISRAKVKIENEASPGAAASEAMESSTKVEIKQESEEPGVKKKKKKRNITWAVDDKLVAYHYYEPDDEERVAVQHIINFHDAQHQEAIRERQRVEQAKRLSEDKMAENLQWYRPRPLDVKEIMERGANSQEKISQKERESKILAHLFFSKSSLPISPGEPEPEAKPASSASSQPIVIPHDEKGTVYPQSKGIVMPEPEREPEPETPSTETAASAAADVTLPPALAALLATATKGVGNPGTNAAGSGNAALSNVDVQALLKKLVASQEQGEQGQNMNEPPVQRFPSPLMSQPLRVPGRVGLLGPEPLRHGIPEYRSRGLLPTPGPPLDPTRFLGLRGRFPLPGGPPRMRHPMPGHRMPGGPMGRGGMPNRFPLPNKNKESGEDYYGSDGDIPEGQFPGRGRGVRPRGGRGRPMCRHFMSPRGCMRGKNCTFLHPRGPPNGPPV